MKCRSCGADTFWCKTVAGNSMPVDAEPTPDGNLEVRRPPGSSPVALVNPAFDGPRYKSHFATCPKASSWRKKNVPPA